MNPTNKKTTLIQFIKFGLVGVSNAIISLAVYSLLVSINCRYEIANFIGFSISVINAFFWNKKFVFKNDSKDFFSVLLSFIKVYIVYAVTGLVLQTVELKILIEFLKVSKYLSQIICIIINLPINFLLNKVWAFNSKKRETNYDE